MTGQIGSFGLGLVESSADGYGSSPSPPAPSSSRRHPKELRASGARRLDLSDWLADDGLVVVPPLLTSTFSVPGDRAAERRERARCRGQGPARKWLDLIRRALNHHPAASPSSSKQQMAQVSVA
ncbi:hypothetical protein Zm00014a_021116 [Zea mays]|uniref:Uncharacterized protein n=1 Tax=Zea mays TaxID=4577 RepID=A0A3L6E941_MAIZE|nr:hypothetical protein Zm00014a_021116 [Zea mays]